MKTLKTLLLAVLFTTFLACESNSDESETTCENTCDYTLDSGETAGTVPSSLDGAYTLTFAKNPQSSNNYYADGIMGTFTISNNTLTVEIDGKECITLTNPVQTSASENTFKNTCGTNLTYAVSTTTAGDLNEINIGNLNNQFLGQFTE
tara:strand:- start:24401 stop:24847 length:447 start_codon:yes stop_codon:yes gene_type:complete